MPFLFVSARTENTATRKARELGADDYIFKPFGADELVRAVRAKLARRRAAVEEIKRLASLSTPDPDGLTAADYVRADRDHPRALEGGDAADRALEKMARDRRRRR